jgi:hypothetical protein
MRGVERLLVQPLANWDGHFYSVIATRGYRAGRVTTAFWPLYPALMWAGQTLTGWRLQVIGLLISNVAFLAALLLLHRLVRRDFDAAVAGRTVWLLALFPTAFYFSAVYTEALFLLLTVAALACGRAAQWGRATLAGALAALTRSTGVLVLLPLGWWLVRQRGGDPRRWWAPGLQLALVAAAPLLFVWHLATVWGDPLVFFYAQRLWHRAFRPPWESLPVAWEVRGAPYLPWLGGCLADLSPAGLERCRGGWPTDLSPYGDLAAWATLLVFVPLAVVMVRRLPPAYSLYALAGFLVPLLTPPAENPLMSLPRFVIVLFPFFITLALLLRRRWLFGAVLALSAVLGAALLMLFSTWEWIA